MNRVSQDRSVGARPTLAAVNPAAGDRATVPGEVSTVLFLGSSDAIWSEVQRAATEIGLTPAAANDPSDALAQLEKSRHAICVLQVGADGETARTLQAIRTQHPGTIAIGVGHPGNPEAATAGLRAGLFDVINLPADRSDFAALLSNARDQIAYVATQRELPPVEVYSYGLFGTSAAMRDVMRLVQRAAPSRCGVILCGERGTGREMVARAIHAHGLKPRAPFVRVDCAAPTPQDLENELFGHPAARPAERGPKSRRLEQIAPGSRVHEAIGGTLFLENVVEMPDRLQARLARLLRDREAIVSGERESIEADVRPIAGLEPSTSSAVEEGRLREDLFERLSVIRIDLPALRHRREDVPLLAIHFLKEICRSNGSPVKTLSRSALTLLAALPWRGNARELRTLLERLVLLVPHGVIRIEDVLAHVRLDATSPSVRSDATLREARMQFEREYIRGVLQQHHGRMGEAARCLGIQRTNLYRKVRSLKLSMPGMDKRR